MYDNTSRVIDVDIDEILPNRFQPRIQFDEEEILELSDSIKEHGVIQPIVVRTIGDKYEIVAGERRYKASVLAGKETVPVIVRNLNDKDSAEIALIENVQRKNLTPIEEALSYKKILDMGYITQENLASKLGKSQSSVANKIRLLNLSDEVQEALLENKISERHARSLLKLETSKLQNEMLNKIIADRLTVRKTDEEIEKLKQKEYSQEVTENDLNKKEEKGEISMNNNEIFGMPSVPQNPQQTPQTFDVFTQSTPVVQESPAPMFDIFAGGAPTTQQSVVETPQIQPMPTPVIPEVPVMQPTQDVSAMPSMEGIEFDAEGNVIAAPEAPQPIVDTPAVPPVETPQIQPMPTPVIPEVPVMQPTQDVSAMPSMEGIEFDAEGNVIAAPTIAAPEAPQPIVDTPAVPPVETPQIQPMPTPVIPEVPVMQPTQDVSAMPSMEGIEFDAEGNVIAAPTIAAPEAPQPVVDTPAVQPVEIPQIQPIVESPIATTEPQMVQQSDNLFSFGTSNDVSADQQQPVVPGTPELKMPEPIIVTDYSKQYDPVMPQQPQSVVPQVEFKEVINAIRECSSKIEQFGFKIDVEEYDMANLYQVIFKVEK